MNANATLRLDRVQVRNFRCFAECEVDLHPTLTVIVAENGRGKTALLEAIAASLGPYVNAIAGRNLCPALKSSDVRRTRAADGRMVPAGKAEVSVHGMLEGQPEAWTVAFGERASVRDGSGMDAHAKALSAAVHAPTETGAAVLPLVASYPTSRLWTGSVGAKASQRRRARTGMWRVEGYAGALTPRVDFDGLTEWYGALTSALSRGGATAYASESSPMRLIAAVNDAVRVVLRPTGWSGIDYPRNAAVYGDDTGGFYGLVAEHPDLGRLPLSWLSDGVKNTIALVADIAFRCALLNGHLGEHAAKFTPGVLLIDEVDMHLHPSWQQQVVGLLQEAFPALQIVVTTHSPQVLTTVEAASIRILEVAHGVGDLHTPTVQTMGVESADVLARIMGVDAIPDVEAARKLSHYKALIQQGSADSDEGDALREFLMEHFGAHHPLIVECRRLLRLQELKVRAPAGGKG